MTLSTPNSQTDSDAPPCYFGHSSNLFRDSTAPNHYIAEPPTAPPTNPPCLPSAATLLPLPLPLSARNPRRTSQTPTCSSSKPFAPSSASSATPGTSSPSTSSPSSVPSSLPIASRASGLSFVFASCSLNHLTIVICVCVIIIIIIVLLSINSSSSSSISNITELEFRKSITDPSFASSASRRSSYFSARSPASPPPGPASSASTCSAPSVMAPNTTSKWTLKTSTCASSSPPT